MGKELTSNNLGIAKEHWIDTLIFKRVKLEKCIEKRKREQDKVKFQLFQKDFLKHWKETRPEKGKCLRLRNSSSFGIVFGRKQKDTEDPPYETSEEITWWGYCCQWVRRWHRKKQKKRWWKKLVVAQEALMSEFIRINSENKMIPEWWSTERTVLLPKTKDLSDKKEQLTNNLLKYLVQNISGIDCKVYAWKYAGEQNLRERETWSGRRSIYKS